jgi:5-methylcytosine-specific restriction protein A
MIRSPMKRTYRNTGPSEETVTRLLERSGRLCESCDIAIGGPRGLYWQVHHRRPRAMGGTRWEGSNLASNLLILCTSCHSDIESRRVHAMAIGRLVSNASDPAVVAVLVAQHWMYLGDDFGYHVNPPGAS